MASTAPRDLNKLGQSLWLDNITRDLLDSGTLKSYIETKSVTGLTSNPTIFDNAISKSKWYDEEILRQLDEGHKGEALFFNLAATVKQAQELHAQAAKPNLFIKIPGTTEGLPAIEDAIYAGVPVNVTLLFSTDQYLACADAYMKGLERRVAEGKSADVRSVASLFISRWDTPVADKVPADIKNTLGLAVGHQCYAAYRDVLESDRFQRLQNVGARPQRLLFASTGTKDKSASDILYVKGLAAPNTVNTMPEGTLLAFSDHGTMGEAIPRHGGDFSKVLKAHQDAGIDLTELANTLQSEGAKGFVKSWHELMGAIESKSKVLT
jgi:transaldolase